MRALALAFAALILAPGCDELAGAPVPADLYAVEPTHLGAPLFEPVTLTVTAPMVVEAADVVCGEPHRYTIETDRPLPAGVLPALPLSIAVWGRLRHPDCAAVLTTDRGLIEIPIAGFSPPAIGDLVADGDLAFPAVIGRQLEPAAVTIRNEGAESVAIWTATIDARPEGQRWFLRVDDIPALDRSNPSAPARFAIDRTLDPGEAVTLELAPRVAGMRGPVGDLLLELMTPDGAAHAVYPITAAPILTRPR